MKCRVDISIYAIIAYCLLIAACSVNPVTGKNQLQLVSTTQEVAIGEQNYSPMQQAQGARYTLDPAVQAYVQAVGKKLAAVSDAPQLPYEFVVLNNPVPNAWALPGGKIAINRGLLALLEDESELAAVLGHEIVHAAARHSASQMTRSTVIGLGAQIVTVAAQTEGYGDLAGMATQIGGSAWLASYGRKAELESDYYGMEYMSLAGYSPDGAVRLQKLFVSLNDSKSPGLFDQLFTSHPPSQERLEENIARAASLPPGQKYRERYQQKVAQIKKDQGAYDAQGKAMVALEQKRAKDALAYLDEAIALQPNEGQFWELKGHAWKLLGNSANAEKAYSTAINKSPDYFGPRLYRGLLRYKLGRGSDAIGDLQQSYTMLPTAVAAYYLGELSLASGDQQAALSYYRNASQGSGEIGQQAKAKLTAIELPLMPANYVLSKPYIHADGYLRIALKNNSSIAVRDVKVQFAQMIDRNQAGQVTTLRGSYRLSPGQEMSIETHIGPFGSAAAASGYQTRVIAATPVAQP